MPMDPVLSNPHLFTEALASSHASSATASALNICSHTRELRGDSLPSWLLPDQDELEELSKEQAATQAPEDDQNPALPESSTILELRPGTLRLDTLVAGAAAPETPGRQGARKLLVVGWDAADWKVIRPLLNAGELPNLRRLIDNGATAPIATLQPTFSPMLWTSIATGKRPFQHGIHGFTEPRPDGSGIQRVSNLSRTAKAFWNILSQNDLRSIVVGWWPSYPAEPIQGAMVSDHFQRATPDFKLVPGMVHPPQYGQPLAALRLNPADLPEDILKFFVPQVREIDQQRDRRLYSAARVICECANIQTAATWLMDREPWDVCAVYFDAIDHFSHGFMRYRAPRQDWIPEQDFLLYKDVVEAGYRLHDRMLGTLLDKAGPEAGVILLSDHGFYSDHLRPGFVPQTHAGPTTEHRNNGVFLISGPAIKPGAELSGVSLLDVAPTILTLLGLPVGEDMDGRPVTTAFTTLPVIERIPSWEKVNGDAGLHPPHMRLDVVAAAESLDQLVALGYVEEPDADHDKAVKRTVAELRTNLAESLQDAGRHQEAIAILRELRDSDSTEENADDQRIALRLFVSASALGLREEMKAIAIDWTGRRRAVYTAALARANELRNLARQRASVPDRDKTHPLRDTSERAEPHDLASQRAAAPDHDQTHPLLDASERAELRQLRRSCRYDPALRDFFQAQVFRARRQWADALECLDRIPAKDLIRTALFTDRAELLMRLNRWTDAEIALNSALTNDPDDARVHFGLARLALHRRDYNAAAKSALNGIALLEQDPVGHYLSGIALCGLGQFPDAASAFTRALSVNPNFPAARRWRSRLYARHLSLPLPPGTALAPPALTPASRQSGPAPRPVAFAASARNLPPITTEVVIVTGLPRSGTSMLMQMLVAGGLTPLTDGLREADEDNPRGYFEFEPVKQMAQSSTGLAPAWLEQAKGRVVKIVAPMIAYLPEGVPCRVVMIERDLDEILASQQQMILRRGSKVDQTEARRTRLKQEYLRLVVWTKGFLAARPDTRLMCVDRAAVLKNPGLAAAAINQFLGGNLDPTRMAAEIKPELNRQRGAVS